MILAIDIGNTSTHFGLFNGKKLVKAWRFPTNRLTNYPMARQARHPSHPELCRGTNQLTDLQTIVSSVVPSASKIIKKLFPKAIFISHKNAGVKVKLKKPAEVGIDRLVNAVAAYSLYGGPAIIIDFGTATTFDVISAKGEYLGGAIAPGIVLARDALHERTAKLPKIEIKAPKHVIGKSTTEAIQSGLVYGYVAMVEGMIKRIKSDSRFTVHDPRIITTGGYAKLIGKYARGIAIIDTELTLKGLNIICQKN
ncbi:MAG: type III pantothenate kinase [bacterium]